MAVDMFLKLDGIDGESQDAAHKGEIEIFSFSWGVNQTVAVGGGTGGAGAGKASFQDLHFEASLSKATPKLMIACASGQHISDGTLTVRKAGDSPVEFLKIKIADVFVSSIQSAGAQEDVPTDSFSLNFAKIEIDYSEQSPTGVLVEPIVAQWNVLLNATG